MKKKIIVVGIIFSLAFVTALMTIPNFGSDHTVLNGINKSNNQLGNQQGSQSADEIQVHPIPQQPQIIYIMQDDQKIKNSDEYKNRKAKNKIIYVKQKDVNNFYSYYEQKQTQIDNSYNENNEIYVQITDSLNNNNQDNDGIDADNNSVEVEETNVTENTNVDVEADVNIDNSTDNSQDNDLLDADNNSVEVETDQQDQD